MGLADFGISVDGGGPLTGGIEVPGGAVLAFVPVSTVGWLRVRWEIPDYPEGWATPAGWTLDGATGVIYSTAFSPPNITLPNEGQLWGIWMPILKVNEQIDDDENVLEGLFCDTNAVCVLSPSGLRDIGAREEEHFVTPVTAIKKWLRSYQRNLRALENPKKEVSTTNATPKLARRWYTPLNRAYSFRAVLIVDNGAGEYAEYEVKAAYVRVAGALSAMYVASVTTLIESAGLTTADVGVVPDGGGAYVDLKVTGVAATNLTWKVSEFQL